jgi:hypothetical protein
MSDIGGLVEELIAAGTPPGIAAQVVALAFAAGAVSADFRVTSADITAEKRREKDRIRQKIRRENLRTSADSADSPQMSQNASLSKEDKKEIIKEERGERKQSVRGHRLPDDWQPTPIDMAIAHELIGQDRSRDELEKFRDHWKQQPGSKGVKLDWAAAWRNWTRRAAEYGANRNGNRPHSTNARPAGGTFFDGLRSLAADISGHDPASGNADPEIPRGRFEIDG